MTGRPKYTPEALALMAQARQMIWIDEATSIPEWEEIEPVARKQPDKQKPRAKRRWLHPTKGWRKR